LFQTVDEWTFYDDENFITCSDPEYFKNFYLFLIIRMKAPLKPCDFTRQPAVMVHYMLRIAGREPFGILLIKNKAIEN
jgi:hypothetical protein